MAIVNGIKGVDLRAKCGSMHPCEHGIVGRLWGDCPRCGRHFQKISSVLAESIMRDLNAEIEWLKSQLKNA